MANELRKVGAFEDLTAPDGNSEADVAAVMQRLSKFACKDCAATVPHWHVRDDGQCATILSVLHNNI